MGHLEGTRGRSLKQEKRAVLVVGEKFGRLANRLWLFSHVIGHAIEHGHRVLNPCFDEYTAYFANPRRTLIPAYPVAARGMRPIERMRPRVYSAFHRIAGRLNRTRPDSRFYSIVTTGMNETYDLSRPEFRRLATSKKVVVLAGWRFRDYAAFDKHADRIREYFAPAPEVNAGVSRILSEAKKSADVLIGVHMRAADYRSFLGGKYYYDPARYNDIMHRVLALFPGKDVRFLICSDEVQDPKNFPDIDFSLGNGDPAADLVSFAGCDYIIGPPSTYTMWSSFYGKVPLMVVRDPYAALSRDSFTVIDGRFDINAEVV